MNKSKYAIVGLLVALLALSIMTTSVFAYEPTATKATPHKSVVKAESSGKVVSYGGRFNYYKPVYTVGKLELSKMYWKETVKIVRPAGYTPLPVHNRFWSTESLKEQ